MKNSETERTKAMYKRIIAVTVAVLILSGSLTAFADNSITKSQEFTAKSKDSVTEFEKEITENGTEYELSDGEIKYEILSEVPDKKTLEKSVLLGEVYDKQASAPEETEENGLIYKLAEITYTDTVIKNRKTTVVKNVDYDLSTVKPEAAETMDINYSDGATGKNVSATLQLQEVKAADVPVWYSDVQIPIKFTLYDTSYYIFNGTIIPANGNVNELEAVKGDLLEALELDESLYKIDRFEWDGEAYTEDGAVCRNALAYGQRFAGHYTATYSGTFSLPDADGYTATANYKAEIEDTENFTYTIKATATYEIKHRLTALPYFAAGGGIAAVGVFLVLFILSKRNVVVEQNGKVVYKTRVSKNTVIIDKVRKNHSAIDISVIIKKSYTSRHIQENIKITDNGNVLKEVTIIDGNDLILPL